MGGSARSGDDDLDSAVGGLLGVFKHAHGGAVGRNDRDFVADSELLEQVCGALHDGEVALASHDDTYLGGVRAHSF